VAATLTGGSWTMRALPNATGNAYLLDVDCPADGSCVAVGATWSGKVLVETLSGGLWTESAAPTQDGAVEAQLTSVSCRDAAHCVGVGWYGTASRNRLPMADTLSDGA